MSLSLNGPFGEVYVGRHRRPGRLAAAWSRAVLRWNGVG